MLVINELDKYPIVFNLSLKLFSKVEVVLKLSFDVLSWCDTVTFYFLLSSIQHDIRFKWDIYKIFNYNRAIIT
jgi:hypothetical protein